MPRVTEFSFTHDDFALDGFFAICDELLIEIEVDLHGAYTVACVDRMDRGFAVPVPEVITEYVKTWALTDAGKATIRKAYEEAQPADPLHDEDHPDNSAPLWRSWRAA
ncbi:hypothetical protein Pam5_49 [Pseudanabaena phage Pam5]|nr:hypothetical protein Pam5_49 [Pseudanabaena phage Pam5]